jgi:hypothetical protein
MAANRPMAVVASEGVHDAPHRAEEADVGRDRTNRCEEGEVAFHRIHLALEARAHGAPCAVHESAGIGDAAFAQLLVLAHAAGKNALHGTAMAGAFGGGVEEVVEAGAGPELAFEFLVLSLDLLERKELAENRRPAANGHQHEQQHDELHHDAGIEHQMEDVEILVHGWLAVGSGE